MKILFLAARFPEPPVKGDQVRAYYQIQELSKRHEVTLLCFETELTQAVNTEFVTAACREVILVKAHRWERVLRLVWSLFSRLPVQVAYYQSHAMHRSLRECLRRESFDVVLVQLMRMAPYLRIKDRPAVLVDLIDSLALSMQQRARAATLPLRWLWTWEARRSKRLETQIVADFEAATLVSEADRTFLGSAAIEVNPNGVDCDRFSYNETQPGHPTLIFFGNLQYFANVEAVRFLAKQVFPLIQDKISNARLQLIGASPDSHVLALQSENIEVTGYVPSLIPYLREASVAVFPMHSGSGMQNKVLEAMAAGVPVVATPQVLAGIPARVGREIKVGYTPNEIADHVITLLENPEQRQKLTRAARQFVAEQYNWERSVALLEKLLQSACHKRHRTPQ